MPVFDTGKSLAAIQARLRELNRPDTRIIAVSKTHGPERIEELLRHGQRDFGETRGNEGRDKFPLVKVDDIAEDARPIYHHIGPLQSGGARQLPGVFSWVHGASSLKAIRILGEAALRARDAGAPPMNYLIQARLTDEETKAGGMPAAEIRALDEFPGNDALHFRGFMTMGPQDQDPGRTREVFHELRELRDELVPDGELSMGMSGDWEIAAAEGATMIRLGSVLFGRRGAGPWKPTES